MKKDAFKETAKSVINKIVDAEANGWPPICSLFTYQPERPQSDSDNSDK